MYIEQLADNKKERRATKNETHARKTCRLIHREADARRAQREPLNRLQTTF